jgi:hypothetical protein
MCACGRLAQLEERLVRNEEAVGSSPMSSTKIPYKREFLIERKPTEPFALTLGLPSALISGKKACRAKWIGWQWASFRKTDFRELAIAELCYGCLPWIKNQNSTAIPMMPTVQAVQYMILSNCVLGSRP